MSTSAKFFFSLLLCLGGGLLTGLATQEGVQGWYTTLEKPYGTPPNFVFPIVWSTLYTLMAVSLTLLWNSRTSHKEVAYLFFFTQLLFNFVWSWIFFAYQSPGLALIDIELLLVATIATMLAFWRHTRIGSLLFLPYLLWVLYANYLNFMIWWGQA